MRTFNRPNNFYKPKEPQVRINERITAPEVRVLDENNEQLGVMAPAKALEMARAKELDLVEVAPNAKPPVVRILNYDKYRYQQMKADQKQKQGARKVEIKGIRLKPRIGDHDLAFKARQATKFLEQGNKVEVQLFMRGREWVHQDLARGVMDKFVSMIEFPVDVEMNPTKQGNNILMKLIPGKKKG